MADKPDVNAAIAAAMGDSPPAPDTKVEGTVKTETPPEGKEKTPGSTEVGSEVETAAEIDAFKTKWGVDLSALPDDDSRAKFVKEFEETNKTIGKLQRENAALKKTAEPPSSPPAPPASETTDAQLTDEQLAEALGIDLETSDSPERDQREIALTRMILDQEARFERLEKGVTASTSERVWTKAFDDLETRFGKLPGDMTREDIFGWADEQGITSPEAAYWAAVGPVRATVAQALEKRIIELKTASKKSATSLRPTTSANVEENQLKSKTVREGIKEAFEKARLQLGIELKEE